MPFETLDSISQSTVRRVNVRVIDLINITRQNDFRVTPRPSDDGFDLMRSQILRLIHNQVLFWNTATPNVSQWFDIEHALIDQLLRTTCRFFIGAHQKFHVIKNRLHPRIEFLFDIAWQVTDVTPHGENRTADQQALKSSFIQS